MYIWIWRSSRYVAGIDDLQTNDWTFMSGTDIFKSGLRKPENNLKKPRYNNLLRAPGLKNAQKINRFVIACMLQDHLVFLRIRYSMLIVCFSLIVKWTFSNNLVLSIFHSFRQNAHDIDLSCIMHKVDVYLPNNRMCIYLIYL